MTHLWFSQDGQVLQFCLADTPAPSLPTSPPSTLTPTLHACQPTLSPPLLSKSPDWGVGAVLSWQRFQRFPSKMAASTFCPKMESSSYGNATSSYFKGIRKDLSPTDTLPSNKDDIMAVESGRLLPLKGGMISITSRSVCPWAWHTLGAQ